MIDKHEQFLSSIKDSVSMTQAERDLMRQKLKGFTTIYEYHSSSWLRVWSFVSNHAVASVAVVVFLLAGGTSTLAHNAIPGDMLYPIKSQFNDRVRAAVIVTDDGKMDFELKQLGRDLDDEERVMDDLVLEINEAEEDETPEALEELDLEDEEYELNQLEHDLRDEEEMQVEF